MNRVAAVDCGTNSIRLLVTEIDAEAGQQHDLDRRLRIVRLGQGVDATGRLADEALDRTMSALNEYVDIVRRFGVEQVRMVATSATRDASNAHRFVDGVRDILGVDPEVVSGDEEAALSFAGATRELGSEHPHPYLVVDIGGGSTEFVSGRTELEAARSVDIGSVRITERHFAADPPTAEQVAAARADIDVALDEAARTVPLREARTVVGLAGTITTIGAIQLGLSEYDSTKVHHARMPADAVAEISDRLLAASHEERAAIPVIHPGRLDVIAAGSLILRRVVERSGAGEVLVSERDILDGIAWSIAG
ncbi:Ppx/GppA phosphatase family protein [Phytoactinopolyspora halotolerans]|uniref:Ppx/GppA family phosphatase n=1 Tax=Phytoactinopolyspora halotolerans TaxID=1981512 RepID=A0A6L9S6Y4_9ACTN|nr:Ppx/GppA phosphatase family protein [Phytoactinopolyspora halotolerans]NED99749.1 Ppx/GppA family phosphatase [Phytoactinopolyspora halotolerans]